MRKWTALAVSFLLAASAASAADYADISIQDLEASIKAKTVTVIDVNGADSFANRGHIPGAIDFATCGEKLASVLPKDKGQLVVAYCGGPACGAYKKAADVASQLGYTNVKHLSAGISGWVEAGKPVEKGECAKNSACTSCEKKG